VSNFHMDTIIRELLMPLVDYAMAAAMLSPNDVEELELRLSRAYRQGLGVSKNTSGAMLTLPKHMFGFGFTSLKQRYLDITLRTINRTLNSDSIPGQLGRAALHCHLGPHGNLPASVTATKWKDLRCPWLRKCSLIYALGDSVKLQTPDDFGGPQDDMLALIQQTPSPPPAELILPHLRRLWTLGLRSVAQLTIPGSSELYLLEDFTDCFPSANGDFKTSFGIIRRLLARANVPPRPTANGQPNLHSTSRTPARGTPTGAASRSGRRIVRPSQADETVREESQRMVAPMPPAAVAHRLPPRPTWRDISNKITFIKTEVNPDHDCQSSESARCFELGTNMANDHRMLIYHADGRLAGSVPWRQANSLHLRFQHACRDEHLRTELKPGSFAEEMCLLLTRYRNGELTDSSGAAANQKNHHALPHGVMQALHRAFSVATERFASPLNVHPETERYYSVFARDALFGARCDAYSLQWTGASVAHPEPETAAMNAALHWGIKSAAATTEPVLSIFVIPAIDDDVAHQQLLRHPMVQRLTRVPRGRFTFTPVCYTNLGRRRLQHAHHAVDFLIVANAAGLQQFDAKKTEALGDVLAQHGSRVSNANLPPPHPVTPPSLRPTPATVSLAGAFSRVDAEVPCARRMSQLAGQPLCVPAAATRPLKYTSTVIYTDGSSKFNIAGAGVVTLTPGAPPVTEEIHVGPGRSLKGELVGISSAVRSATDTDNITIASDCLTAMSAIQNGLYDAGSMHGHAEERELHLAVKLLQARAGRTTFIKVKSHIGITGNELADKAAEAGRTNPNLVRAPLPANAGPQPDDHPPKLSVLVAATDEPVLKADLAVICSNIVVEEIQAEERARVAAGRTNGQSVASRWIEAATDGDYINPTSFAFDKARLAAKVAHTANRCRMRQRPRNFGARCPAPDCQGKIYNQLHGRGACGNPTMRSLITDCSNESVHLVAAAALAGDVVGCTLLVNAGTKYGASKREDHTIPGWALPGPPGNRGFPDKPDLVLIKNWDGGPLGVQPPPTNTKRTPGYVGPTVTFVIVEHKMTQDLHLRQSRNYKRNVYAQLALALAVEGWDVELCTDVTDPSTWYGKDCDRGVPAHAPAKESPAEVDATEHDDSDIESVSSDGDDDSDDEAAQAQQSQESSQHPQPSQRAPLHIVPLERGEIRYPIHTIIVGQTGCHLASNKAALAALGVRPADIDGLLLSLSVNAVQRTHHCLAAYKHLCRGGPGTAHQHLAQARAPGPPSSGVG